MSTDLKMVIENENIEEILSEIPARIVVSVLRKALDNLSRDESLHARFYDGDITVDLPEYIRNAKVQHDREDAEHLNWFRNMRHA